MTPIDFMTGVIILVMGYILGICVQEITADYREKKRTIREWKQMKKKELDII